MKRIQETELEAAKRTNLVVYVNGLQDPIFLGEDNTASRWTTADIGKLYSFKCVTLPLNLQVEASYNTLTGRLLQDKKTEVQEHFRIEFWNALRMVEYERLPRESAVTKIRGPFKILDVNAEESEAYIRTVCDRYPQVYVENFVPAVLSLTTKEQNPALMEAFGLAVKKGSQEYVNLKKMNDIGKRFPWKVHREYDLLLLYMTEELQKRGLITGLGGLADLILEDLAKDKYTREKRDVDE
ncbi:hypothetical protein KY363_05975 [Candidatus Woesearchaeota archaeon]|nr:hypothetical protein [Candidatus Woesearchaeota archaeon]